LDAGELPQAASGFDIEAVRGVQTFHKKLPFDFANLNPERTTAMHRLNKYFYRSISMSMGHYTERHVRFTLSGYRSQFR